MKIYFIERATLDDNNNVVYEPIDFSYEILALSFKLQTCYNFTNYRLQEYEVDDFARLTINIDNKPSYKLLLITHEEEHWEEKYDNEGNIDEYIEDAEDTINIICSLPKSEVNHKILRCLAKELNNYYADDEENYAIIVDNNWKPEDNKLTNYRYLNQ